MALAEDAIGKIRRKIKIRGKGFLRFCEEPRGEEQAEIIAGKQAVCGDGVLESGIDCFWHAGGERGQFQILMRIIFVVMYYCCKIRMETIL